MMRTSARLGLWVVLATTGLLWSGMGMEWPRDSALPRSRTVQAEERVAEGTESSYDADTPEGVGRFVSQRGVADALGVSELDQATAPNAGAESIAVEAEEVEGRAFTINVRDPQDTTLADVQVFLWWDSDELTGESFGRTGPAGRLQLVAPDVVPVYVDVHHAGHAAVTSLGPYFDEATTIEVTLVRGGALHGRCVTADGKPVKAFDLLFWQADPAEASWEGFEDEDGRFALEGVPLGPCTLLAFAPGLAPGAPLTVDVSAEETEVELSLPKSRFATGTLVAGATGAPVKGARVSLYARHGNQAIVPLGPSVVTNSEGEFTIDGLSPHGTALEIVAEGYATQYRIDEGGEAPKAALGTIPLSPLAYVELRILAAPGMGRNGLRRVDRQDGPASDAVRRRRRTRYVAAPGSLRVPPSPPGRGNAGRDNTGRSIGIDRARARRIEPARVRGEGRGPL